MIKIALSFDDGRIDQYRTFSEILKKYNLPATLNVTTGYITDSISKDDYPSLHNHMTIDQLIELGNTDLFEIGGHGRKHNNDVDNFSDGILDLYDTFGNHKFPIGVASPQCRIDLNKINEYKEELDKYNIKYIRTGDRFFKWTFIKKALRKVNRFLKSSNIYNFVYSDSCILPNDNYILHSAIVTKFDSLNMIKKFIYYAISKNKSYILMFHSILKENEPFYNDTYSWNYDDFVELCKFLVDLEKKQKIKVVKDKDLLGEEK